MSDSLRDYVRVRTICEGALELTEDRREAWVRQVCSGERELEQAILDLLRRIDEGGKLGELFDASPPP